MKKLFQLALLGFCLTVGMPSLSVAQGKTAETQVRPRLISVGQGKLGPFLDQTVQASGIIGSYLNETRTRYRFTMDDGSSVVVVGIYPTTGGARYELTARVSRGSEGIELQEVAKTPAFGNSATGRIDPLLIAGGLVVLGALAVGGVLIVRSRNQAHWDAENAAAWQRENDARELAAKVKSGSGESQEDLARNRKGTLVSQGRVIALSGPHKDATFPLLDHRTPVGRTAEGGVKLDCDPSVSGLHAEIVITADRRVIYEDKSRNGSVVNGKMLNEDRLEFTGPFEFTVGSSTLRVEPSFAAVSVSDELSTPEASPAPEFQGQRVDAAPPSAPTYAGFVAEVEMIGGPQAGKRFSVGSGRTTIGREGCDILLVDRSVSRSHAAIEVRDGIFVIVDSSTHGTQVNGNPVTGDGYELRDGDEIELGRSPERLQFRDSL